jgi:Flp pilus assembly pilin Flp
MEWQLVVQTLRSRVQRDHGQDLMEYGLLMALIAVVALAGVQTLGTTINELLWEFIARQ